MEARDKIVLDKSIFDAYNAMAAESEGNSLEFLRDVITYAFHPTVLSMDLSKPCNIFAKVIIDKDNPIDNSIDNNNQN